MGKLFVVPTPIGNLKDVTLRALEVLREVDAVACEDTRQTLKLLNHYGIKPKKLISYYAPKEEEKVPTIVGLLKEGKSVALVSDAGTPGISDPGYRLIRRCVEEGIPIEVLPGPSAVITALVGSGLPTDRFVFLGFPPKKGLKDFFKPFAGLETTFVLYESPHRLLKTLEVIKEVFGNPPTVVAKELTKLHEEFVRGETTDEVVEYFRRNPDRLRGEFVVVFRPSGKTAKKDLDLKEEVEALVREGLPAKEVYKRLRERYGDAVRRREVYRLYEELKGSRGGK
ncbi:MAG: 16S rRNA (cytidine(1402)-2'-O)-methyltransferase [Aquificae bacterium]|nr:16S rRNA (cytidine(1402)-2'-O)-methyltransferase [Aquificota bacterium]